MTRNQNRRPSELSVEISGKTCTGRYSVSNRMVTVSYGGIRKTTQLSASDPETVAGLLLRELIRESEN